MSDNTVPYQPASTMSDSEALLLIEHVVSPSNLKEVRCYIEDGRKHWFMEWRIEGAKVRYERRGVEGEKPMLLFAEDKARGYVDHFYVNDANANMIAVLSSLRLDSLSFHAYAVAKRLAEELEDMFHGI